MARLRPISLILLAMIVILTIVVVAFAPDTTSVLTFGEADQADSNRCLADTAGKCYQMPAVNGVNLDNQPVRFPDDFSDEYYLVVMPFDRDQQVNAITWLPRFQALAEQYETVSYFNIAALPDLNAGIRFLVIQGMSAGMRDDTVRQQVGILFLEEQQAFLDALAIDDTDTIRVFIIGGDGTLYYRDSGVYDDDAGDKLTAALADIVR